MKSNFIGYYPHKDNDFKKLWKDCFFVFDTSALLNLYEYSPKATDELLKLLSGDKLKDRIWMPHQVGLEFFQERIGVIDKQKRFYDEVKKELGDVLDRLEKGTEHPFLDERVLEGFKKQVAMVEKELEKGKERLTFGHDDKTLEHLLEIFDGKVGDPYLEDEREEVFKDGAKRYKNNVPPGYGDSKKPEEHRKYGDLTIWFQIIHEAKARGKPVILVTSDEKEDWWTKLKDSIIGPRPELIAEMQKKAGQAFYMYRTSNFLTQVERMLKENVSQTTIDDVGALEKAKKDEIAKTLRSLSLDNVINRKLMEGVWQAIDKEYSGVREILKRVPVQPGPPKIQIDYSAPFWLSHLRPPELDAKPEPGP